MTLWGRVFATLYDPFVAPAERRGLGRARATLLAQASGQALEIGAGTGLNVRHYRPGADVVFTEPDPAMAKRLRRHGVDVVEAGAEALPFDDESFDAVVSTLVLCTVPDVPAALAEIGRVLRPSGRLLFLEHVRAEPGTRLERWQDRLHDPWQAFACGCHCNRDLLGELDRASFRLERVEHLSWWWMPPIVRPVVLGSAVPSPL